MSKYIAEIFANGRIALVPWKDFEDAIEAEKEILVFCGGWSGGYARAFGASKVDDFYGVNEGRPYHECYSYEVRDTVLTPEDFAKYHRIIVTDGIRVYMKTGEQATRYDNFFCDYDTMYETYERRYNPYIDEKKLTPEEFEKARCIVDVDRTLRMIRGEDAEEVREAIKGYLH